MNFKLFIFSSVAVAAAGTLLSFSVYASELEDNNESLDDYYFEEDQDSEYDQEVDQEDDLDSDLQTGGSTFDDFGGDDSFFGDVLEVPALDDDFPDDSVIWGDDFTDDDLLLINDDSFLSDDDSDLVTPYANYNTYYGSISSTYLEYMRGYLPKLSYKEHYVCARVSQYDYIFAYGEGLTWTGSLFTGFNVMVITWNTYNNGTFSSGIQSAFNLSPGSYLVYSDLTNIYPSLADSSAISLRQILILFTVFCLSLTMIHMYNVRKVRL